MIATTEKRAANNLRSANNFATARVTARTGRPTVRTPATLEKVKQALEIGATRSAAAVYAGISRDTLHDWMRIDEAVRREVELAEVRAEMAAVAIIRQASLPHLHYEKTIVKGVGDKQRTITIKKYGPGNWKAAAWWLERRHPNEWGRKVRVDIGNAGGRPFEIGPEEKAILDRVYGRPGDPKEEGDPGGKAVADGAD